MPPQLAQLQLAPAVGRAGGSLAIQIGPAIETDSALPITPIGGAPATLPITPSRPGTLTPEARRVLHYAVGGATAGTMISAPFDQWWVHFSLAVIGAVLAIAIRENEAIRLAVQRLADLLGRIRL